MAFNRQNTVPPYPFFAGITPAVDVGVPEFSKQLTVPPYYIFTAGTAGTAAVPRTFRTYFTNPRTNPPGY